MEEQEVYTTDKIAKIYSGCLEIVNQINSLSAISSLTDMQKDKLERLVGKIDHFVQVPFHDAYYKMDEWWPEIEEFIDEVELCIPAAGMAGRVVQKRLWNLNKDIHSIDLGSVIDAVAERSTRTWIDRTNNIVENLLI